jgi:hypothetical protein
MRKTRALSNPDPGRRLPAITGKRTAIGTWRPILKMERILQQFKVLAVLSSAEPEGARQKPRPEDIRKICHDSGSLRHNMIGFSRTGQGRQSFFFTIWKR